ncbi:unnamed protein product [Urochloa humidicola]
MPEYERRQREYPPHQRHPRHDATDIMGAFAPAAPPRRFGRTRIHPPPPSAAAIRFVHLDPYAANLPISDAFVPKIVMDSSTPFASAILTASWPVTLRAQDFTTTNSIVSSSLAEPCPCHPWFVARCRQVDPPNAV